MSKRLDPEVRDLAEAPNFAHVATTMADGTPQSSAVWIGVACEHLVFFKEPTSVAFRNLQRDPSVAISIIAVDDPYRGCSLRGRVVEVLQGREAFTWLDASAREYTGKPYPPAERPAEGALLIVEVESASTYSFDAFAAAKPPSSPDIPA
jgi:PPOX class probable F420-dependent enzyme